MSVTTLQPPVYIGRVIQNALVFNFKRWREASMNTNDLLTVVARLFHLLEERHIDYVLVGGVALLQYIEGRNTEDIDLIVATPALKKLPEIQITSQDKDFARGQYSDLQIDFLLTRNPLFEHVRRKLTTKQRFVEQEIRCATVEGLLLLKLYALPSLYRQGNFARVGIYENDIATLLYAYRPEMEPLLKEFASYVSAADLASVRDIVDDLQRRIARFGGGAQTTP